MSVVDEEFRRAYAEHRAQEGRALDDESLRTLPYLNTGPLVRQWTVRARTFDVFHRRIVTPMARAKRGPLNVADLGAGNGWLSYRMALSGHRATAIDTRDDAVDGLGAAAKLSADVSFECVVAPFEHLPFARSAFDIAVFNASLHYAQDLSRVLNEAARVTRSGGVVAILDSPFYKREADGLAMVAEKHREGAKRFGAKADVLLSQNFIEFLTPARLQCATPQLSWHHHRVLYPLWYEMRPLLALLCGSRPPSRFDFWTAIVP